MGAVMKKTALAEIFILAFLFSAVAGAFVVSLGKANPMYFPGLPPTIYIDSPLDKMYNGSVLLHFSILPSEYWRPSEDKVDSAYLYVDNVFYESIKVNSSLWKPFNYSKSLENLTDGQHAVRIDVNCAVHVTNRVTRETVYYKSINATETTHFGLDTIPPTISITTIENKTYYGSDLQVNFAVSESFHNAFYALDGQNVKVAENFILSDLPVGTHSLTVYAYDRAGNIGASGTITFTIADLFSILVMASAIVVTIIVCIGLFAYFKKRK